MGAQVVRMARVGGAGGGLGKHIDGETRPESAAPRELDEGGEKVALEPVVLLDEEGEQIDQAAAKERVGAAQAYMQKCRRKKTRGRQPMGATTWVFAGPPRYDGEKERPWSSERVRAWSKDCVKWLVDRAGPGSRLAHCALHQDEGAPHLHATLIVADEQGRLGWNRVRNRFTVEGKTGKLLMSGLQDNFHETVGQKHRLERGEVGSGREHAPVDRELGIRIRVEEERNRTHVAKVQAGKRIAEVLAQADGDAAQQYRDRLDDATRATADAEERAALATKERDEARRQRDMAAEQRDRARSTGKFTSELVAHLQRDNERLKRAGEASATRSAAQVAAAKQESADELARVRQERDSAVEAASANEKAMEDMRWQRDEARSQVRTVKAESATRTTERDDAVAEVEKVKTDRDEWIDCFLRVLRDLEPGREELERAAGRGGIGKEWLVQEVVRGRGLDR